MANVGTDDETSLLDAVASGNRDAYERLFRRYHGKVHRFVYRMLRDAELAEEVSSDTLLTVWTDAARFRGQSSVSSWILGIAYRKALKALRTRKRYAQRHEHREHIEAIGGDESVDNPECRLSDSRQIDRVADAIERLSDDHQTVVRLTAVGHSCAEIADIVGCPRNTVKTRMFHARIKLRKLLGMDDRAPERESTINE